MSSSDFDGLPVAAVDDNGLFITHTHHRLSEIPSNVLVKGLCIKMEGLNLPHEMSLRC